MGFNRENATRHGSNMFRWDVQLLTREKMKGPDEMTSKKGGVETVGQGITCNNSARQLAQENVEGPRDCIS